MAARGSALIAVLWSFTILSIVILSAVRSTTLEVRVARNWSDIEEARWLAVAGVERAKAAIHESRRSLRAAAKSHDPALASDPAAFRDVLLGNGIYRVIRSPAPSEGAGQVVFGIGDEESRLDVNRASTAELEKLPGMTRSIAAAIVDWRDDDDTPRPGGAEREEYASLEPPSEPRNGPYETLRDMLLVIGVTADLLFGEDTNTNGILDPEEDDGLATPPMDDADGALDAGWSAYLTVDTAVENKDARGEARVNVASASEDELAAVDGISADIAKAIVAHRGQKKFDGLANLLDVEAAPQSDTKAAGSRSGNRSGGGAKVIGTSLLQEVADRLTTTDDLVLRGVVNLNTADSVVLACLPGVDPDLAEAIVAKRIQLGYFSNVAQLLDVQGLSRETFARLAPRVAVRSGTFRIVSEGRIPSTGATRRIIAVVRPSSYEMETLDWRDEP